MLPVGVPLLGGHLLYGLILGTVFALLIRRRTART